MLGGCARECSGDVSGSLGARGDLPVYDAPCQRVRIGAAPRPPLRRRLAAPLAPRPRGRPPAPRRRAVLAVPRRLGLRQRAHRLRGSRSRAVRVGCSRAAYRLGARGSHCCSSRVMAASTKKSQVSRIARTVLGDRPPIFLGGIAPWIGRHVAAGHRDLHRPYDSSPKPTTAASPASSKSSFATDLRRPLY